MKVIYLSFLLLVLQIYFSHGSVDKEKSRFGKILGAGKNLVSGGKELYGGMKNAAGKLKGKWRRRKAKTETTPTISSTTQYSSTPTGSTTSTGSTASGSTPTGSTASGSTPTGSTASETSSSTGSTPTGSTASGATETSVTTSGTTVTTTRPQPPGAAPPSVSCIQAGNALIIIIAQDIQRTTNAYRRTHGSPDLTLDDEMICDAQKYAKKMSSKGVLEHESSAVLARRGLGENIGMSCMPARNGPLNNQRVERMARNVAKRWYDEVCQYNFDEPKFSSDTGHFTEVVWSGSRKLGVGYSVGRNAKFPGYRCVYVVGRYSPAGNNIGARRLRDNVRRGSFTGAYCRQKGIKQPAFTLVPLYKRNRFGNKAIYKTRAS